MYLSYLLYQPGLSPGTISYQPNFQIRQNQLMNINQSFQHKHVNVNVNVGTAWRALENFGQPQSSRARNTVLSPRETLAIPSTPRTSFLSGRDLFIYPRIAEEKDVDLKANVGYVDLKTILGDVEML